MTDFLQRRATALVEEAKRLAAEGRSVEACRCLLETCDFVQRCFGSRHRELPELLQLLSDLHHARGDLGRAEHYQTRAWELRHLQVRHWQRLRSISRLDERWTLASADAARWPPPVHALFDRIRNDPNPGSSPEVVICGPPRSGKTHLLHALGHEAICRPWRTRVYRGDELLETLVASCRQASLRRRLARLDRYVVLLVDDLDPGHLSRDESDAVQALLLHRRSERRTLLAIVASAAAGDGGSREPADRWGLAGGRGETVWLGGAAGPPTGPRSTSAAARCPSPRGCHARPGRQHPSPAASPGTAAPRGG
jgi:hypothetical protein